MMKEYSNHSSRLKWSWVSVIQLSHSYFLAIATSRP
jgi:hypothetical protein